VRACVTVRQVFVRAATGRGRRLLAQLAVRRPADVQRDHLLMRLVLNIIWLVFAGIWMFIAYAIAALICFILIITIPFGVAALRIGIFGLWPFGRTVVKRADAGVGSAIGNVLWFILCGWWLAIVHVITGVLLCITIIGIPLGLANFKLIPVSLLPFGREIVTIEEAQVQGLAIAVAVPRNPSSP
jgi:uncharacterized membrane protein YccF (DUF307 family)